jgi:hypothetical protein
MVAGLLLAGCGGGAADVGAGGELSLVTDEARMVSADIGPDGGTLEATAEDGTRFVLTVPAGALAEETRIEATPAHLGGAGGLAHTVIFGPTGLHFYDWARLEVITSEAIPVEEQLFFGIDDEAREVTAAFVDVKAETPTLLLDHFSGYGLAKVTDAQRAALLQHQAANAEAQIRSEIAVELGQARQEALLGVESGADVGEIFENYRERYETQVLGPLLEAAGASCAGTTRAIQAVLGYERQRQLLGVESPSGVETGRIVEQALGDGGPCEREAIEKCKAAEDPSILVTFLLGRDRQRQLLGLESTLSLNETLSRARQICLPAKAYEIHAEIDSKPSGMTLDGFACSLAEPFRLRSNGDLVGTLIFRPRDEAGGSWTYKGVVGNTPEFGVDGSGSYSVNLAEDGQTGTIEIDLQLTIHIPMVGPQAGGGRESLPMVAMEPCD